MLAGLDSNATYSEDAIRVILEGRWSWLVALTRELIEAQWTVIDSVANRLLEIGAIAGSEVRAIFRQCGGIYWEMPIFPVVNRKDTESLAAVASTAVPHA
jgi:hypothetical protein